MLVHRRRELDPNLSIKIEPARGALAPAQPSLIGVRYRDTAMEPPVRQLRVGAELFGPTHVMEHADESYFTKSRAKVSYWLWTKCDEQ